MGTHPIFESDFDCLTEEMGLSTVTIIKTVTSRVFSVITNILRRQLIEPNSVVNKNLNFHGRVLDMNKRWIRKRTDYKLKMAKWLQLDMKYPESELVDPKSEAEIIEQAAYVVVNSVNLFV